MESFDLEGLNCDGLGAPPTITFWLAEVDSRRIDASPPGARITIDAWGAASDEVRKSRIRIVDTEADVMVLDIVASHIHEPRWPEWNNATMYAAEVAAAFYWSMWRRSELRKREGGARALGFVEGGDEMVLSDKDLKEFERACREAGADDEADAARELLAAREVVRAASKLMRCDSFEGDEWFGCEAGLMAALAAYDKARKGKVT